MVVNCQRCGKAFVTHPTHIRNGRGKHCGRECYDRSRTTRVTSVCLICGQTFEHKKSAIGKYCSRKCSGYAQRGKNSPNWKGGPVHLTCVECGEPFEALRWLSPRPKYCSLACTRKAAPWAKSGKDHPNWKGGKAFSENGGHRYDDARIAFRSVVFERDNYTCQDCGERGGRLNAHHMFTWRDFPELRFEVWNGETLCLKCHKERHKGERQPVNAAAGRLF